MPSTYASWHPHPHTRVHTFTHIHLLSLPHTPTHSFTLPLSHLFSCTQTEYVGNMVPTSTRPDIFNFAEIFKCFLIKKPIHIRG